MPRPLLPWRRPARNDGEARTHSSARALAEPIRRTVGEQAAARATAEWVVEPATLETYSRLLSDPKLQYVFTLHSENVTVASMELRGRGLRS